MSRQPVEAAKCDHPAWIRLNGLHKIYPSGTHALRGVDLQITRGEGVVLLGHNGSGKSTLLRCLNLLEKPTRGTIHFDGRQLDASHGREVRTLRRRIATVFQKFNLVGNLSAFQNVLFGGLGHSGFLRCMSPFATAALRNEAMSCLERVSMADMAAQRADSMSGGQQQRVAIARSLMQNPEVLLADEPIASLDPRAAREVMDLLWEVGSERKMTVICTLHQLDMALNYGDRLVGLKHGQLVLDAPSRNLATHDLHDLYVEDGSPPRTASHAP